MMSNKSVLLMLVPAVAALLLGYLVYVRVASAALNVETGLILLASVGAALVAATEFALALAKAPAAKRANVRVLVVTSIALLFGLELGLRALGWHTTYLEKNDERGVYRSVYSGIQPMWFHVHKPNIEVNHARPEFRNTRKTNALGLSEREIPPEKSANEYRVFALGDSFTEGIGAAYHQTWIKEMERRLAGKAGGHTLTAFNAGIGGSDPWYEYMLLKEKLLAYRPDLVIVAINFSDIHDMLIRGGRERFLAGGTTRLARQAPTWEWLYGLSFIVRHVVHDVLGYDKLFITRGEQQAQSDKAVGDIDAAIAAFVQLGRERGFRTLIVMHPNIWEALRQRWGAEFAKLLTLLRKRSDVDVVDMLDAWKAKGLLDKDPVRTMYWPIDGHNNATGYAAFGEVVAAKILDLHLLEAK